MFYGFKQIKEHNTFHARIFLTILYLEKWFKLHRLYICELTMKIIRKFVIQGIYNSEVHPDSFSSLQAISSCRLPHPYLIIIHRSASIQTDTVIFHNVTIGVIENNTLITAAQLGEKVYIGTGATILGHLTIGNNAKIGDNTLIIKKNIPPAATIVGLYK